LGRARLKPHVIETASVMGFIAPCARIRMVSSRLGEMMAEQPDDRNGGAARPDAWVQYTSTGVSRT
jgi:hypothetical protein